MIVIKKREDCCGCFACENICPSEAITLSADNEGFKYPLVNKKLCNECNLCIGVCPILNSSSKDKSNFEKEFYACKNKNNSIREKSSSGGVFSLIAEEIIKNEGVVFGAAFNDNFIVEHICIKDEEELGKIRGSKYVQSNINDSFKNVKKYLNQNKTVLFSGTPCQISGLRRYLNKEYKDLITVDIVCHGVPSPKILEKYLALEKSYEKSNIDKISFRDKEKGWRKFSFSIDFENGSRIIKTFSEDIFMKGFLRELYQRPSCHKCKFKLNEYESDITLGDYWGIQMFHPEIDDDRGTSFISVNSEKGKLILNKISKNMNILQTTLDDATKKNRCILKSIKPHKNRKQFFKYVDLYPIDILIKLSLQKKLNFKDHMFLTKEKIKRKMLIFKRW